MLNRGQRRADARTAAKLAWAEESEGVAEILKEEGLLDVDAMQQLDVLVGEYCFDLFGCALLSVFA